MTLEREIWFIMICILTLGGLVWGICKTNRLIEAPFLYSVSMAVILCPQLYIATYQHWRVPAQAFHVFCIMVVLSTIGLFWGYTRGCRSALKGDFPRYRWVIDDRKLFRLGFIIAGLGTLGSIQLRSLGEIDGLWRGWPVYWVTLATLSSPGITLILISYFQSRKTYQFLIALMFSVFPFLAIFEAGSRSATLTLPFIYLFPLLAYRPRLKVPRWLIIVSLLAAFIVVYAFPYWRSFFAEGQYLSAVQNKPLSAVVNDLFISDTTKPLEIVDGMIITGAHYELNKYGWGISKIYNSLIFRYVPGGLIGHDLKASLMIGTSLVGMGSKDWVESIYGMPVAFYTAKTSFSELFGEFYFFGSILVFGLGYLFGRIHKFFAYYFDGRSIIFLGFFLTLPATLPYGALLDGMITRLPIIAIMLVAFRLCLVKEPSNFYN